MYLQAGALLCYCSITFYRISQHFLGTYFHTLLGPVRALSGIYIIFISQISGQICCLKINSLLNPERFNGFHQIICHFGGTIYRHTGK